MEQLREKGEIRRMRELDEDKGEAHRVEECSVVDGPCILVYTNQGVYKDCTIVSNYPAPLG